MTRRPLLALLLLPCLAACGAGADPRIGPFVEAEAQALCLVQQRSFATQAAIGKAYRTAETRAGLSRKDVDELHAKAENDASLRRRVSARVGELCGSAAKR